MRYVTKASAPRSTLQPFFQHGIGQALPLWLSFRDSIEHPTESSLSNTAGSHELTDQQLITQHLQQLHTAPLRVSHWLMPTLLLASMFIGVSAMTTALSYSGKAPVNIWLILGLFAAFPLLTTLLAAGSLLLHRKTPLWHPARYLFRRTLNTGNVHSAEYSALISPWLTCRLQALSLAFQASATLTFLLVITFKGIAFGWSSTLAISVDSMAQLIQTIAWPWSHWLTTPNEVLITASQVTQGQNLIDVKQLGQWWPFLLLTMITYGILPRLLFIAILRKHLRTLITQDITHSGIVERFLQARKHTSERIEAVSPIEPSPPSSEQQLIEADLNGHTLISWQRPSLLYPKAETLGVSSWQADSEWITNNLGANNKPMSESITAIAVLIDMEQTPTAELSDTLELIRHTLNNPAVAIELTLLPQKSSAGAPQQQRRAGQRASWQHFAKQHQYVLRQL